jgi:hypothetical protein
MAKEKILYLGESTKTGHSGTIKTDTCMEKLICEHIAV